MRWSFLLFLLLLSGLTVMTLAADSPIGVGLEDRIAENSEKLVRLRREIDGLRGRVKEIDGREAEIQRDQTQLTLEIGLTRQLLSELDQRERLLEADSRRLKAELVVNRRMYAEQKQTLARSLRTVYMQGQGRDLELILTSESLTELVTRMKFSAMVTRLGGGLVERTRTHSRRIAREQTQLNAALAGIWENREEAGHEQGRLELLEVEQIALLRELKDQRQGANDRLLELSMNEQRLGYILADLEQQRSQKAAVAENQATNLVELAGSLEWPVNGRLLRGFGRSVHPRFKTVTLNNGLNIGAAVGSAVSAVAEGQVEFSDDLPGFGQCVILDHGAGYYTLYAHLDQVFVSPGSDIARGQVIAEVGHPAGGEPAQLYFEVRHGRTPLDPADWLKSR